MPDAKVAFPKPIPYTGSLDKYDSFEVTPYIGSEFSDLQLTDLLAADNADELIRDLAVLVSQRGVVFFRNQNIDDDKQRVLGAKLGELTGKPQESTLHVHPTEAPSSETGEEILVLQPNTGVLKNKELLAKVSSRSSRGWHTDITFEKVPSDYAILKILSPPTGGGGDTLWASGYHAYEKLTPAYRAFLETLTAHHSGEHFKTVAAASGHGIVKHARGHPLNQGENLQADHPLVRTNPVTGWKSIYVNPIFTKSINGLSWDESKSILDFLNQNLIENHDTHVRFKWNANDIAIWDNRSTYHTPTNDFTATDRIGHRVLSVGEIPYYDPNSVGIHEALKKLEIK